MPNLKMSDELDEWWPSFISRFEDSEFVFVVGESEGEFVSGLSVFFYDVLVHLASHMDKGTSHILTHILIHMYSTLCTYLHMIHATLAIDCARFSLYNDYLWGQRKKFDVNISLLRARQNLSSRAMII